MWEQTGAYTNIHFVIPQTNGASDGVFINPPRDMYEWCDYGIFLTDWPITEFLKLPDEPGVYAADVETWGYQPTDPDDDYDSKLVLTNIRSCRVSVASDDDMVMLLHEALAVFSHEYGDGFYNEIPEPARKLWHKIDEALATPHEARLTE